MRGPGCDGTTATETYRVQRIACGKGVRNGEAG
jgi:hypothetical protein